MTMKKVLSLLLVLCLAFCFVGCGNEQTNAEDPAANSEQNEIISDEQPDNEEVINDSSQVEEPISEDDKAVAQLIDNFYTYLNNGDRRSFKSLFGKYYKKGLAHFAAFKKLDENSAPYDMGKCIELERIRLDYDALLSNGWGNVDEYDPGYTDIRFYVELYKYTPGNEDQIYMDVKEGTHYNYFVIGKKKDKYKIISVESAYDMTKLVELGMISYTETTEGEMTPLDIQLFGERFIGYVLNPENGGSEPTEYNGFFNSTYSSPKEMNFENFMWCFMPRQSIEWDDEEYAEVEKLEKKKHGTGFPEGGLNTPLWKYNREDVDRVLEKYADISTADLDTTNTESLLYSKKYDSYYNFTSDARAGVFNPDSGYIEDGVYIMTELNATSGSPEPHKTITKFKRVGDEYKILSREID